MTSAPGKFEAFLGLVRKSGLVDEARLTSFVASLSAESDYPDTEQDLARRMVDAGLLTPFQAGHLLKGKYRGFLIAGKYRLLDLLGAGGMAKVFLCEHVLMRRPVALKVLPDKQAENPASVERFVREARAVAALKHPNIVQAYDLDSDGKMTFLVMEYVDGVNLQDLVVRGGPISVERACHYVAQSALGLQHAHESGLVHRDIKPGNLLLDRDGTVKILDMGLARFFRETQESVTQKFDEKSVMGTADYLPPEQAIDSSAVDIRADLYSLGATLFFLLTGEPPFGEGTVAQKLLHHQMSDPPPLSAFRGDVPPGVQAALSRMMRKDPAHRFQEPHEVAEELAEWARGPVAPPSDEEIPVRAGLGVYLARGGPATGMTSTRTRALGSPSMSPVGPRTSGASRTNLYPASARGTPDSSGSVTASVNLAGSTMHPQAPRPRPAWLQHLPAALAVGLFLVGTGAAYWWLSTGPRPIEVPTELGPALTNRLLLVDRTGVAGRYTTIKAALAAAMPGDTVLVRENPWRETLTVAPGDIKENVTLEGRTAENLPLVWQPGLGHPQGMPILEVRAARGLRLKGFDFDAANGSRDAVVVGGLCPGLTVEAVRVQRFGRAGVACQNLRGTSSSAPVTFSQVNVRCRAPENVGFRLAGKLGESNEQLQFLDCRIDGPGRAAFHLAGPARDVLVRHARAADLAAGVLYADEPALPNAQVLCAGCTFYRVKTLLDVEAEPKNGVDPALFDLQLNLVVGAERFLSVAGEVPKRRPGFLASSMLNYSDTAGPGADALGVELARVGDLSLASASDRNFLRYPRNSPLATQAPGGKPVGAPPAD